jgi:hypothetical protein
MKSRPLFTDGWNSFWHVVFGILSIYYWIIIPIFVIYQLMDYKDVNLWIDLLEFAVGFSFSIIVANIHSNKYDIYDFIRF